MKEDNKDRRLIEESLPIKEISLSSIKEKNMRKGNISQLHMWWSRKPLTASRAAIFSSLVNFNKENILFLKELVSYSNLRNKNVIFKASKIIRENNEMKVPKILDPFAGGGSIPFEMTQLGCKSYASDLNPVAYILLLATAYYPQKYGFIEKEFKPNKLNSDFLKYSKKLMGLVKEDLEDVYPFSEQIESPMSFLWTRLVTCKNPACNGKIPLLNNFWISERDKIAIKINSMNKEGFPIFEFVEKNIKFDPKEGLIKMGSLLCPYCNSVMKSTEIQKESRERGLDEIIYAIVTEKNGKRNYRLPREKDYLIFNKSKTKLHKVLKNNPDLDFYENIRVPIQEKENSFFVHLHPTLYGYKKWRDFYNPRQQLLIVLLLKNLKKIYLEMFRETNDKDYSLAILTYLCIAIDNIAHYNTRFSIWIDHQLSTFIQGTSISMKWSYSELNPFCSIAGSWDYAIKNISEFILTFSINKNEAQVFNVNASKTPFKDNEFDGIITDPPYYDSVMYSDLSDFFYVILKRGIGEYYSVFKEYLSPKKDELVQNTSVARSINLKGMTKEDKNRYLLKDKEDFEIHLKMVFSEFNRILKDDGLLTLIFAHKTLEAWETLVNGLLESGFIVTASWPLHTERNARMRANRFAALASSIFIVCRKRLTSEEGYFNEVKDELKEKIYKKLDEFWKQGIRGADFFISAIGPAVEVFGKYKKVKKLSGEEVTVAELLDEVRKIVTDYSLHQILHDGQLGNIDDMTRFYVLWRWAYGNADVPFDDARKLAQALGTEPDELLSKKGMLNKKGDKVSMFEPWDRKDEHLGEPKHGMPAPMVDVIHRACKLIDKNKDVSEFIEESGYAKDESIKKVIQAIAEILPEGDKERRLLQIINNKLSSSSLETDKFKSQTTLESYKEERK